MLTAVSAALQAARLRVSGVFSVLSPIGGGGSSMEREALQWPFAQARGCLLCHLADLACLACLALSNLSELSSLSNTPDLSNLSDISNISNLSGSTIIANIAAIADITVIVYTTANIYTAMIKSACIKTGSTGTGLAVLWTCHYVVDLLLPLLPFPR
ncbi:hypothetical protein GQ42DRAFT_21506 [Ramicandelaber brevisporus]|nr:hypothetical protein GQ42DRAFT_21506 [Ramicandelaber brevisporus]